MTVKRRMSGKVQRSTKLERYAALEVLKEIWQKAYTEKRVLLSYKPHEKREMDSVFNSLADYRKKIRAKPTENPEIYHQIMSCSLKRPDEYSILIERKPETLSGRTNAVLSVAQRFPELGLNSEVREKKHDLSKILADFTQNPELNVCNEQSEVIE